MGCPTCSGRAPARRKWGGTCYRCFVRAAHVRDALDLEGEQLRRDRDYLQRELSKRLQSFLSVPMTTRMRDAFIEEAKRQLRDLVANATAALGLPVVADRVVVRIILDVSGPRIELVELG